MKRGAQSAPEGLPHPLWKEGTAAPRPSRRRVLQAFRRPQGPALGGGRPGATEPLRHPQATGGSTAAAPPRSPHRPTSSSSPAPPPPPSRPSRCLPSAPSSLSPGPPSASRGSAQRGEPGKGLSFTAPPERGRADGPPSPTEGNQRPSPALLSRHLTSRRLAQPTTPASAPARAHRRGGRGERRRGGAEALRPAPKAQPPGRGREVRRRGRRACVRPIPIATRRLRVRGGGTTRMLVGHAQPFSLPRWRPAPRPCTQHRLRCGPTRGKAGPGARWRRPRGRAAGGGERFREAGGGRGPWPGPGPAAGRVPLPPTRWRQQRDGLRGRNV